MENWVCFVFWLSKILVLVVFVVGKVIVLVLDVGGFNISVMVIFDGMVLKWSV